ncbi:MAG: hypothetical protein CM15mP103_12180 [Gammaproteobacteria bacterium]|nr:MAG: hypothetical protein CM15mP103_12180 [Gammaproteobacteria bacterium]
MRRFYSDEDGRLITDQLLGIYYKPDFHFGGVQGGPALIVDKPGAQNFRWTPRGRPHRSLWWGEFAEMWVSALAHSRTFLRPPPPNSKRNPRAASGVYPGQLSGIRTCGEFLCHALQPRLQDDLGWRVVAQTSVATTGLLPFRFSPLCRGRPTPVSKAPFRGAKSCFKIFILQGDLTPAAQGGEKGFSPGLKQA